MKTMQATAQLVWLLCGLYLAAASMPLAASPDVECRQEAEEYGIPPEQMEDYISGCILSRGGGYALEPHAEDYSPPEDTGETAETEEAGSDVPQ
jgi:hypothetical protein